MERYDCPECGSDDTRSFKVIYTGGTSQVSASSMGFSGNDTYFAESRGTSQSALAKSVAPPHLAKFKWVHLFFRSLFVSVISFVFTFMAVVIYSNVYHTDFLTPLGWGFLAHVLITMVLFFSIGMSRVASVKQANIGWDDRWDAWQRSSLCARCGARFEV